MTGVPVMQLGPDNTHTRKTHNPTIFPTPRTGLGSELELGGETPQPHSRGERVRTLPERAARDPAAVALTRRPTWEDPCRRLARRQRRPARGGVRAGGRRSPR